jgi:cytochrome b involved in lipid metabolism
MAVFTATHIRRFYFPPREHTGNLAARTIYVYEDTTKPQEDKSKQVGIYVRLLYRDNFRLKDGNYPAVRMTKQLTYAEVQGHSGKKDLYVVIHDKVYDITSFVDEHP